MTVIALEGAAIEEAPAGARAVTTLQVTDEDSAAHALRLAMSGAELVIHATAPRRVLDALYDDLRRLTRVEIRAAALAGPGADLTDEEQRLLALLASGVTLGAAARELHLSPRTADRRLASARLKLGATTTTEAIARGG